MFDTIHIKNFTCSACGTVHEEFSVQTKDLNDCLDNYSFPDILSPHIGPSFNQQTFDLPKIDDNKISAHGICPNPSCDSLLRGEVFIKDLVICGYNFSGKFSSERHIEVFPELIEILKTKNQLHQDLKSYKQIVNAFLFSVYNGDIINEEKCLKLEKYIKTDVLKNYGHLIGQKNPNIFITIPFQEFFEILHTS